jgi:hypothetical protein
MIEIEQPPPTQGRQEVIPFAVDLFMRVLAAQTSKGIETYGNTLHTHNGRNPLMDAFAEQVDALLYLAQAIMEQTPWGDEDE